MLQPYYGPAGIFSTDNAQSDQMQIEAEQFDPEEYQEQPDSDHAGYVTEEDQFPPTITAFVGSLACQWWDYAEIEEANYPAWMESMKTKHKKQCGCSAELLYSYS